jgi:hypothetical protein
MEIPVKERSANILLQLARPRVGHDVRRLIRELTSLAGVARVVPAAWLPRMVLINYDPKVIAIVTLLALVKRGWNAARLVGTRASDPASPA